MALCLQFDFTSNEGHSDHEGLRQAQKHNTKIERSEGESKLDAVRCTAKEKNAGVISSLGAVWKKDAASKEEISHGSRAREHVQSQTLLDHLAEATNSQCNSLHNVQHGS